MADKVNGKPDSSNKKPDAKIKHCSEDAIQAECFQWFWNTYPDLRYTMFAVPNGGARHLFEANRLKATGVVAGVSDLVWIKKDKVIFIEMKNEVGEQSKQQKAFEDAVTRHGHLYIVLRGVQEFKNFVLNNLFYKE